MTVVNVLRLLAKDISAWCRVIMMKRSAERGVIADDAEHDPEPEPARQRAVMIRHKRNVRVVVIRV
jgi:hypothetical protein